MPPGRAKGPPEDKLHMVGGVPRSHSASKAPMRFATHR